VSFPASNTSGSPVVVSETHEADFRYYDKVSLRNLPASRHNIKEH